MKEKLSKRLQEIVDALPLKPGIRVLEIGCGPGAMAREMARRIQNGYVLGIDRSAKAIQQATSLSTPEIKSGRLNFRLSPIEEFKLAPNESPYDIAVAIRVGALDGRHPEIEEEARRRILDALKPGGRLFIDGGNPLKVVKAGK